MKSPEECASLAEVRAAIDTLDRELLALLGRRAGYVHAAARFKTDAASVRAPDRVRVMLEQRRAWAAEEALDPEMAAKLFTLLVEYFTRREQSGPTSGGRRTAGPSRCGGGRRAQRAR